jgi:F0F1-type ATP synthase beta subunit
VPDGDLADDHLEPLTQVKETFSAYEFRDPEFLRQGDDPIDHRVKQLIRYFTQPFKVSEPFRDTQGESIFKATLLGEVLAILTGKR